MGHRGGGSGAGYGEAGGSIGKASSLEGIPLKAYEPGRKGSRKGIPRTHGIDCLDPRESRDEMVAPLRKGDKSPAPSQRDDHMAQPEPLAKLMQAGVGEGMKVLLGKVPESTRMPFCDKGRELRLVGQEIVCCSEEIGRQTSAIGGWVEDRDGPFAASALEGMLACREVGFQLYNDDPCLGKERDRKVFRTQAGVGPGSDDDGVLACFLEDDGGGAGGDFREAHQLGRDAFPLEEILRHFAESILPDRSGEGHLTADTGGGDGLVGTLAPRSLTKGPQNGLTGARKVPRREGEVHVKTTHYDDMGARRLRSIGHASDCPTQGERPSSSVGASFDKCSRRAYAVAMFGSSAEPPRRRPRPVVLFALLTLVVLPLLLLGLAEGLLRVIGYGFDPNFFRLEEREGVTYLRENREFTRLVFPPGLERPPAPFSIPREKEPDEIRLAVLGASAALGDPDPSFSIGRQLEVMLAAALPERKVTLLNAAMTAINSHLVVTVTGELAVFEPDAVIVYLGNNEVVGPFGPGTVFGAFTDQRAPIRLALNLRRWKLGQLAVDLAAGLGSGGPQREEWGGMQMFLDQAVPMDDPRLQTMYAHYAANLRDIIDVAEGMDAPAILSTVGVNLDDSPPFLSVPGEVINPDLETRERDSLIALLEREKTTPQDLTRAFAASFTGADGRLIEVAENHFHQGRLLAQMATEYPENSAEWRLLREAATLAFSAARDRDTLRFRADSRINETVREVAARHPNAFLADVEAALPHYVSDGIPGNELFWEHVHYRFEGAYAIASVIYPTLVEALVSSGEIPAQTSREPLPMREMIRRLAYLPTDYDFSVVEMIQRLGDPPFTHQWGNERRRASLQEESDSVAERLTDPRSVAGFERVYLTALQERPEDWQLMRNLAGFYNRTRQPAKANAILQRALHYVPDDFIMLYDLGRGLAQRGQFAQAEKYLQRVLLERPDGYRSTHGLLGLSIARQGRYAEALPILERATQELPSDANAWAMLLDTRFYLNLDAAALAALPGARQAAQGNALDLHNLAVVLINHGHPAQANELLTEALELDPGNPTFQQTAARLAPMLSPLP